MRKLIFVLLSVIYFLLISGNTNGQDNNTYPILRAAFMNPPSEAQPRIYWWWLNGNVNPVRLKEELVAMKNAGIAGVDIFDIGGPEVPNPNNMIPAGPAFMGKESLQSIKFAIDEAGKLGMEVNLSVSSSWNAGGSWTKPENAAKTLYFSKASIKGPKRQKIKLAFPEITPDKAGKPRQIAYTSKGRPVYYKEVVVLAIPVTKKMIDTSEIINISAYFDAGKELLDWNAPSGEWEIYRYICANSGKQLNSPSPNSNGLVIDHFDSIATQAHFNFFIDHLKPLLGDFRNTALKGFYLASYEASDLHWTPSLPAEFKKRNGYDIYKFIPAIFNKNIFPDEVVADFQYDFRKTKSDMMIHNHYLKAKEICNNNGLKLISESGGPGGWHSIPVEALKALGALDIPRGEFWNKYEIHDIGDNIDVKWLVKEIAAASNIYKKGLVEEESFTSWQNWQEGPLDLKPLADRAFCEGMNRLVIHGFSHESVKGRLPGIAFYAGTHFNDRNTWWPKIKPFNEYLGRISYILQKSDFVSDVLYYNGEDVPNLIPPKNTHFSVGPGYDYEVINTDILLNKLTVENGELSIPGVSKYKLLYIGNNTNMSPLVLNKLTKLAVQGALIIGGKPTYAQGLSNRRKNDKIIRALADSFWVTATANEINAASFKKGVIYSNILPIQALKEKKILPDFSYYDQQYSILDYIHYKTDSLDFYLVRNTSDRWISRYCYFRQQSKSPEIWDPVTGKIIPVSVYKADGKQLKVLLTLAPYETYFVVFKKQASSPKYTEITGEDGHPPLIRYTDNGFHFLQKGKFELKKDKIIEEIQNDPGVINLNNAWGITFPKGWGAPDSISFPKLISWTESENPGVRYFSGTASYNKNFEFKKDLPLNEFRIYLDLGFLKDISEVWLNGQPLGVKWAIPHRTDITDFTVEGQNSLRVDIANTWSNRLIGDGKIKENYTKTNILKGNPNLLLHNYFKPNNIKAPWAEIPLRESGLLGPVTIQIIKTY